MRLTVSTPTAMIEDVEDVRHVRAEDETGAFGILPGHTDFVTVLPISVVTWQAEDGREGFILVRQGVMTVRDGSRVEIAARGGYRHDELPELGAAVWDELRRADEEEDVTRTTDTRLHLATMRQVERVLRAGRASETPPPRLDNRDTTAPEPGR
ncbi:F0F1 ATP synthase subunit epsilon [Thalassovita mangrovi]|uniref:F0F1 ATP synthase subunit epsilon n=1 Tax=Thalassovita mangrovi TaxID=2692236 RepID=A0A6L8LM45_9RHOB|nr:F0F1 ATP synthase subunit epsilon [Thalassovita mangrovi]MYM57107.1 F0F1 ATP synthase subunit epsilon [Thalassovita mangrovi]